MNNRYSVEICNNEEDDELFIVYFDDLEKAIEFYNDYVNRPLYSGHIININANKIIIEFCNDFDY